MTKSVSRLFGSEARVKLIRLFIFNSDVFYKTADIIDRVKENPRIVRRELGELVKSGLLKKRARGYSLEKTYPHLKALDNFLTDIGPISDKDLINRLSRVGVLKLILVAGLFIH